MRDEATPSEPRRGAALDFTEQGLSKVIAGQPVGDAWPYRAGCESEIERHLQHTVARLRRSHRLAVEADFDSYGSGYASYAHAFCWKLNGSSIMRRGNEDWTEGITVYLGRLAPLAVYGATTRMRSRHVGNVEFIEPRQVYALPPGDWSAERDEICRVLEEAGLTCPPAEALARPLWFDADVRTILGDPPYTVFDAMFYWED